MTASLKSGWFNSSNARSILFARDRLIELISHQSFESFRAKTVSLFGLMNDLTRLIEDIEKQKVNKVSANICIEELVRRLSETDSIIFNELGDSQFIVDKLSKNKENIPEISRLIAAILRTNSSKYRERLQDKVLHYISSNDRNNLSKILSEYVSYLFDLGFDRRFLIDTIQKRLPNSEKYIPKISQVSGIFTDISNSPGEFISYVGVNEDFGNYLKSIGLFKIRKLEDFDKKTILEFELNGVIDEKLNRICVQSGMGKDQFARARHPKGALKVVKSMSIIGAIKIECLVSDTVAVKRKRSSKFMYVEDSPLEFGPMDRFRKQPLNNKKNKAVTAQNKKAGFTKLTKDLLGNFHQSSFSRIINAFDTLSVLSQEEKNEARMISLWSAKEIVCGDPPSGKARITYYNDQLVPIICYRYHRRLFASVHDRMLIDIRRSSDLVAILKEADAHNIDMITNFAVALICPERINLRAKLLDLAAVSPLMVYRLNTLVGRFATPNKAAKYLINHKSRVSYQLHRMYRTRNAIVHGGVAPSFLDNMVVESFDYVRTALVNIASVSRKIGERTSIEDCIFAGKAGTEASLFFLETIKDEGFNQRNMMKFMSNIM